MSFRTTIMELILRLTDLHYTATGVSVKLINTIFFFISTQDDDDDESFLEGIRIRDDVLITGSINM